MKERERVDLPLVDFASSKSVATPICGGKGGKCHLQEMKCRAALGLTLMGISLRGERGH